VRAYDPKILLLGAHSVNFALMSSDCVKSSNKRNSPSNPAFGVIESYAAKLPVDLEELYLLSGSFRNWLLVQSVLLESSS
jgi:hypothetical protein